MLEKLLLVKDIITQLTVCWIIHTYSYKMIAVDLSKQQALDADPRANQKINFTADLDKQATQESISFLKKQKKLN